MDLIASARHVAIACPQRVASLPWPYPIACMHACSRPSPRISLPWPSPVACMHACSRPSPTYRFPCRHSSRPCCVRRSGGSGSRRLAHEPFRSPQDESSIGRCRQRGSSIPVGLTRGRARGLDAWGGHASAHHGAILSPQVGLTRGRARGPDAWGWHAGLLDRSTGVLMTFDEL